MNRVFEKSLALSCSAGEAFAWHERPDALDQLIPPGAPVRVVERHPGEHKLGEQGSIRDGARVVMAIGPGFLHMLWVAVHEGYRSGQQFVDVQVRGPFAYWRHTHLFRDVEAGGCEMTDHVDYRLPMGLLGDVVAHRFVEKKIDAMFAWRHEATRRALSIP